MYLHWCQSSFGSGYTPRYVEASNGGISRESEQEREAGDKQLETDQLRLLNDQERTIRRELFLAYGMSMSGGYAKGAVAAKFNEQAYFWQ